MSKKIYKALFVLSAVLSILILFVSGSALYTSGFYSVESPYWQQQCYSQDLIDLALIVPLLMISALLMLNGNKIGKLIWPGVMIYLIYTFLIYCFDVRFNSFFIEYCIILGLSVYGFMFFLYKRVFENTTAPHSKTKLTTLIAIFFTITSVMFYFLWLTEIVPALRSHTIPATIVKAGLLTNPVHVIDLSIILPLFMIIAVLLFRNNRLGYILTPYLLIFSILMDLTIAMLNLIMKESFALSAGFLILGTFTLILFMTFAKQSSENTI